MLIRKLADNLVPDSELEEITRQHYLDLDWSAETDQKVVQDLQQLEILVLQKMPKHPVQNTPYRIRL